MKILIVSDSHGINGPLRTVIMRESPDMLIHLGDTEYSQSEISKATGFIVPTGTANVLISVF